MTDNLSAADVMAMTKDNDGMNAIWNNPFIYFVWMALFSGGFGGVGVDVDCAPPKIC